MSWIERAKVGDWVICIKYSDVAAQVAASPYKSDCKMPRDGGIYTIRELHIYNGQVGFVVDEIVNPVKLFAGGMVEFLFHPSRFRPLDDTARQVEAIKASALEHTKRLCNPTPEVVG